MSLIKYLEAQAPEFQRRNEFGLTFAKECGFAHQIISGNDYALKIARENQQSLKNAILNVAALGISLNPAEKHAYLVPRDGAIHLDLSYRGLVKLATDSDAIKLAKAELVYDCDDEFVWNGMLEMPTHRFDPFHPDRNPNDPFQGLRGGYCVAKLADDSVLLDHMSAADINKVRGTSKAKKGPWQTWPMEMIKKTIVKRAAKSWPQSTRLATAIDVLNAHEGLEEQEDKAPPVEVVSDDDLDKIRELMARTNVTEESLLRKAGIDSLEALPAARVGPVITYLNKQIEGEKAA